MVSALSSVLLFTICLSSNSQNIDSSNGIVISTGVQDSVTGNLLKSGTGSWTNTVTGSAGGVSGGNIPAYNPSTDTIIFGYTQASVSQVIGNNFGLQGTGIQVIGYNYSWKINNADYNSGTLSATVALKNAAGTIIDSYNYNYNSPTSGLPENFQLFTGTQNFNQIYPLDALGSLSVTFTGKDSRYWAGYYGPRVREPSLTANYRVDPCASNPAYSPTCAGFNDLLTSINIVPHPTSSATSIGNNEVYLNNSFPIATALSNSGSGLALHGFKYGFTYELKDRYCDGVQFIFCFGDNRESQAAVAVNITSSSGSSLYTNTHMFSGENTGPVSMAYQYLFPQSTNTNLMGNFGFVAGAKGNASVYNMYSKLIVTPDPCTTNPYSSSKCTGFTEAIEKLKGTNSTDYATTGYTEPASVTASTASSTAQTFTTSPTGEIAVVVPVAPPQSQPQQQQQVQQQQQAMSGIPSAVPSVVPSVVASPSSNQTSDKAAVTSPANLSFALNLIAKNAESQKAIETAVVQAAVDQAQAAGAQAQRDAVSVASKLTEASISSSTTTTSNATNQTASVVKNDMGTNALSLQASAGVGVVQLQSNPQLAQQGMSIQNTTSQIIQQSYDIQANYSIIPSMQIASLQQSTQQSTQSIASISKQFEVETPTNSTSFLIDRTNPLREIIDAQPVISSVSMEQQMSTVKKEVAINEAAVGIDIGKIALAPIGYNTYLSLTIKDVSFYAPREIYPKQNTVDNVRALRQMSSDTLHRQMVDQQYK